MTKITLLGDSLRLIGYGTKLPELLGKDFSVYQPTENGRYSTYTLRGLVDWFDKMQGSDIVHWNNGLWDECRPLDDGESFTPLPVYVETMARIGKILKSRYPRVIFATTMPITRVYPYDRNAAIVAYNNAVVPALTSLGVEINDLHSFLLPNRFRYLRGDGIHLNDSGINAVAAEIADFIRK